MSHPNDESSAPEEVPEPAAEEPAPEPAGPPRPMAPPVTVYGEGTPVVLLHAFPLDSRMWLPQVEALGGYQAIVPDLRGFGAAREAAVEVTSMDLLADDIAELLDERERALLRGLSMGGYVALAFARRHPQRLGALVLCDTRAGADSDDARAARLAMAERVLAEGVGFLPGAMVPRLLGKTTREQQPELAERVTETILDQDPRLIQVPDAGHLVNLEQAELVNEGLLDFLAPLWI